MRTDSRPIRAVLCLLLAAAPPAAVLVACAAPRPRPWPESAFAAPMPAAPPASRQAVETPSSEEILRFQPDVRIDARMENGAVRITVLNRSRRRIEIGPGNFGVIVDKTLYPAGPREAAAKFPLAVLGPGERASGSIRFLNLGDLTGQYCVFSHPEVRPSRCEILPEAPREPAPPAQEENRR